MKAAAFARQGRAAVPAAAKLMVNVPWAAKLLCNSRTFRELLALG